MAIGHDKRDLLRFVPRDRTKLRNKNYNTTLNTRNEICTLLPAVLINRQLRLKSFKFVNHELSTHNNIVVVVNT